MKGKSVHSQKRNLSAFSGKQEIPQRRMELIVGSAAVPHMLGVDKGALCRCVHDDTAPGGPVPAKDPFGSAGSDELRL